MSARSRKPAAAAKARPAGPNLPERTVMDRLRALAACPGDALLLIDGPPGPDHELLGLCSDALEHFWEAERIKAFHEREQAVDWKPGGAVWRPWFKSWERHRAGAIRLMRAAAKLPAHTPAGIYAKVLLVRASRTGAAGLTRSLASDLVRCAALRESLWPGQPV